jgi:methylation protein EvaC
VVSQIVRFNACASCESDLNRRIFSLGLYEPVNLSNSNLQLPLNIVQCDYCGLTQLKESFSAEINFPTSYTFRTGRNPVLREHFARTAAIINEMIPTNGSVVEIGSNDGTLLSLLRQSGLRVLGVEPTHAAKDSDGSFFTVESFFPCRLPENFQDIDCVVLANTLAHVEKPLETLHSIHGLLSDTGYLIIEVVDFNQMLDLGEFDKFTHEHRCYFTEDSLANMLAQAKFEVFSVEAIDTHGGSIRVIAKKGSIHSSALSPRFKRLDDVDVAALFRHRNRIRDMVAQERILGKKIYGVGGTTRGVTLLTVLGMSHFDIDAITDHRDSARIGSLFPNSMIPIVDDDEMILCGQSATALILAWHVAPSIVKNLRDQGFTGDILIPLPNPRILKVSNES